MSGYYLWVVAASFLVLVQGYFFAGLAPVVPSLLTAVLVVSAKQLPYRLVVGLALWLGALLDSIALTPFGLYTALSALSAWLLFWLIEKGVSSEGGIASLILLTLPVLALQFAGLFIFYSVTTPLAFALVPLGLRLSAHIILTLGFAWLLTGRVQLRV